MSRSYEQHLELERVGPVSIVRFKRRTILEPEIIQGIGDRLLQLAGEKTGGAILLNFKGVESLTSALLGEFRILHRALTEAGGRLAFCAVEPFLAQLFKVVKIDDLIPIYADEQAALQALGPQK
jgi:anti-anti-sigma regulatory factor